MRVLEVMEILENLAPKDLALDFDNVGLLVGNKEDTITNVVVALDVTKKVLDYCISHNANFLIVHHPIIFTPIKSINSDSYVGSLLLHAIKHNINIYVAHTNMDNSLVGINYSLAKNLGLVNVDYLYEDKTGVYGDIEIDYYEFEEMLYGVFDDECMRKHKSHDTIRKVGIISGAGGRENDLIQKLIEKGVDTFISGEFKHNIVLELVANNINVIEIGHYESEIIFVDIVTDILEKNNINVVGYTAKTI